MKTFFLCIAAGSVLAAAQNRTIAILGSSTAAGVGATTYDSAFAGRYDHYLKGLNPAWTLVNLGVGGYTTYQVMPTGYKPPAGRPAPDTARNITKVIALHPHALLICLPSNDIADGYSASEYDDHFDSLHAWSERAGIPVWITTPLPRSSVDSSKRQMLLALRDRILARYAPRAINFYDSLGDAQGDYYPAFNSGDGTHTNNHGHRLLYERVVAADLIGATTALAWEERGSASKGRGAYDAAGLPSLIRAASGAMTYVGTAPGRRIDALGRLAP